MCPATIQDAAAVGPGILGAGPLATVLQDLFSIAIHLGAASALVA